MKLEIDLVLKLSNIFSFRKQKKSLSNVKVAEAEGMCNASFRFLLAGRLFVNQLSSSPRARLAPSEVSTDLGLSKPGRG